MFDVTKFFRAAIRGWMLLLLVTAGCDADLTGIEVSLGNTDSALEGTDSAPVNVDETCNDGIKNQGETGVDCGGPCETCPSGDECTSNDQCRQTLYPHLSSTYGTLLDCEPFQGDMLCICDSTPCRDLAPPSCDDESKNQGETGVDCGGPCEACAPTCSDGIQNQGETGIDCGGPCSSCGTATSWRWAHSGDGNQHDPDDWHASSMALALMHRAGLKNKLVHFDWNNHIGNNSNDMKSEHDWHVNTAREAFGYTNDAVFKNCEDDLDGTVAHLAAAINASSSDNRLVLTCAGPMEVCWRGIDAAQDSKEQFVVVISHSNWNDNHNDTDQLNHQWSDIVNDFDVQAHHINDQNGPAFKSNCDEWKWTEGLPGYGETLYNLLCQKQRAAGDASDAGMVYYMIKQDGRFVGNNGSSNPSMTEVQKFFGAGDENQPSDATFTENNGVVEFEMEDLEPRGSWSFANDVAGYSGTGFLTWEGGDNLKGPTTNQTLISSTLAVSLIINTPGKYRMTITSRRNHSGTCAGAANDQCNDIFTNVNGEKWCKTLVKADWDKWITATQLECSHGNFSAPTYDFQSGENTLLITGRSRGIHLDKIMFTKQ